jgi:hypothetical protein
MAPVTDMAAINSAAKVLTLRGAKSPKLAKMLKSQKTSHRELAISLLS